MIESKKPLIDFCIERDILITPELYAKINEIDSISDLKKYLHMEESSIEPSIKLIDCYDRSPEKRKIQDFVKLFNIRYKDLKNILVGRQELQNVTTISRLKDKKERDKVSIIGLVTDVAETKNNNLIITLEDPTGYMKVLVNKNKPDLLEQCKDLVLDEVIGVSGNLGDKIIFANDVNWPEIPLTNELKKSPDEAYAVFTSDIHVGSDLFFAKNFDNFVKWLNGTYGTPQQKKISDKIKYLIIAGDVVDGVGIYPGHEKDLVIDSIYDQFKVFTEAIKKINKNIKIIISPGNHEPMRIAEPQPPILKEYAPDLYDMDNVTLVTNPATINIHSSEHFSGFNVLIYHGYSFTYYGDKVQSIRAQGGLEKADLIMEFLLKRRHLAPSHTSTLYIPDRIVDPLAIKKVPDFFITGHIHRIAAKNYRNITMLNCGCWMGQSAFQEKVGMVPQPCKAFLVNLQNREIKIMNFEDKHD